MTFDEYQKQALTTAVPHPDQLMAQTIWTLGIAGESGEVIEKWKKLVAYRDGVITPDDVIDFKKELGDILWYIALFADSLGISFDDIAQHNLQKLADRQKRDVIKGSGDLR